MKLCALALLVCLHAFASQFDLASGATEANARGIALYNAGRFKQAEEQYRAALKLQSIIKSGEEAYASIANNLGSALQAQGRLDEATIQYNAALRLQERVFGRDSERLSPVLNNLALIWRRRGEPQRAVPLLNRVLTLQLKWLGSGSQQVAITLHNLGSVQYDLRRTSSAEKVFKQALDLFEKHRDDGSAGATLSFLARMAADRKDYREATRLARLGYDKRVAAFGLEHRDVAIALSDLAELHTEQRQFPQALELLHRAIAVLDADQGVDQHLTMALYRLGEALRLSGQHEAALPNFERTVKLVEQVNGPEHASLVVVLDRYAATLRKLDRKAEAASLTSRADRIHDSHAATAFSRHTVDLQSLLNSR